MSTTPMECFVCNDVFNEENRYPRALPCSHTLCGCCIQRLIELNTKECPFCRTSFSANSAKDVPVNYIAIDFIKYVKQLKSQAEEDLRNPTIFRQKIVECVKTSFQFQLQSCKLSQTEIEQTRTDVAIMQRDIIKENEDIENNLLPKIRGIISMNSKIIEELNCTYDKLNRNLIRVEQTQEKLEAIKNKLETKDGMTFAETASVFDELAANFEDASWMKNIKETLSEEKFTITTKLKEAARLKDNVAVGMAVFFWEGTEHTKN